MLHAKKQVFKDLFFFLCLSLLAIFLVPSLGLVVKRKEKLCRGNG